MGKLQPHRGSWPYIIHFFNAGELKEKPSRTLLPRKTTPFGSKGENLAWGPGKGLTPRMHNAQSQSHFATSLRGCAWVLGLAPARHLSPCHAGKIITAICSTLGTVRVDASANAKYCHAPIHQSGEEMLDATCTDGPSHALDRDSSPRQKPVTRAFSLHQREQCQWAWVEGAKGNPSETALQALQEVTATSLESGLRSGSRERACYLGSSNNSLLCWALGD